MQQQDISRAYITEQNVEKLQAIEKEFEKIFKKINNQLKKITQRATSGENKQSLKKIVLLENGLFETHLKYLHARSNVERLQELMVSASKDFDSALDEIFKTAGNLNETARTSTNDGVKQARASLSFMIIVGIIIGILSAWFITRLITKPLHRVIEGLTGASDQVVSASSQVSSASQSLAEGASEQAASLEETSSSLEEMSSMTQQNADNANQANILMKETNQVVAKANDSMTHLTTSMDGIAKASEETSKIIKNIDEIAFQTNLLALNAAVEAARAGEAGAGFAVVADEVRNLAMRAAEAAKNTAGLIDGIVKKVKEGSEFVVTTNTAFSEVAASSAKVGGLVAEISAASNEQAQGIEQVNKAVTQMDKVTQQNAANAEESASASEETNAQAEQMKDFVAELVVLVGGSSHKSRERNLRKRANKPLGGAIHQVVSTVVPAKKFKGGKASVAREMTPEQAIPLDGDFKDF